MRPMFLGAKALEHSFTYVGDLGATFNEAVPPGMTPTLTASGKAWLAPKLKGAGTIGKFYRNFLNRTRTSTGGNTFLTRLIHEQAKMASVGVPVDVSQTNSMMIAGFGVGPMQKSESSSVLTGIETHRLDKLDCRPLSVPKGFSPMYKPKSSTSVENRQKAKAKEIAQQKQYQDAMKEAQKQMSDAMGQLSPQERAAMKRFGLDNMFGGR